MPGSHAGLTGLTGLTGLIGLTGLTAGLTAGLIGLTAGVIANLPVSPPVSSNSSKVNWSHRSQAFFVYHP